VTPENCQNRTHEELHLKGDLSWGAEKQFENEALMAVRTANFISAFLQVSFCTSDDAMTWLHFSPSLSGGGSQGGLPRHARGGQAFDGRPDDW